LHRKATYPSGEGRLSVSPSVSPYFDRGQSNPGKRGESPARTRLHPPRNPHNSSAAREEITIDSFEKPTIASCRLCGQSLPRLELEKVSPVNTNSISAKTEALRGEIELIQLHERFYRRSNNRSVPAKRAHDRRELRLAEIREELGRLRKPGIP
jgi:hypothetical protein